MRGKNMGRVFWFFLYVFSLPENDSGVGMTQKILIYALAASYFSVFGYLAPYLGSSVPVLPLIRRIMTLTPRFASPKTRAAFPFSSIKESFLHLWQERRPRGLACLP